MEHDVDKLQFRMRHIIPQGLASFTTSLRDAECSQLSAIEVNELMIPMAWGNVAAKVWGPSDGKPVFALHGWLDNAGSFDVLIPLLPKNLRIVAVDIPGHGLSDHYPTDIAYNFIDCLVAIERLSKQLGWAKFSFLSHSLGACMAMMYAGVFPEKVEKMVLLDLARVEITRPETMSWRLRKTVGKILKFEEAIKAGPEKPMSYETAVQKSISGMFGSLDEKACQVLFKRGLKAVDGGYVFRRDRRLAAAPLGFYPKEDQLQLAKEVTAEVLIIKFSEGPNFEPIESFWEHVEALKTKCKIVRCMELPGRHHTHLTNAESVAPIVTEFFNA